MPSLDTYRLYIFSRNYLVKFRLVTTCPVTGEVMTHHLPLVMCALKVWRLKLYEAVMEVQLPAAGCTISHPDFTLCLLADHGYLSFACTVSIHLHIM
jgi:hypothetical protein